VRRRCAILEAPSALGHIPEHLGVERAPGVLLDYGLADGLDARRAGRLPARGYSGARDLQTMVMNPQPLHNYSRSLADAVEAILDSGDFPVVLGGDCSLLLGRRRPLGTACSCRPRGAVTASRQPGRTVRGGIGAASSFRPASAVGRERGQDQRSGRRLGPAACPFTGCWSRGSLDGVEAHKVTGLYREAGTGCLPAQCSWRDVLSARKAATQVSFRSLD
jgi:hypothetical protein